MKQPLRAVRIVPSKTRFLLAAALAASTLAPAAWGAPAKPAQATPEGESIGLYPLQLPSGQEQLQDRLLAQLHDGAASLPRVRAFDLIPRGACAADEGGCLAAAGRAARLTEMVSGQIEATPKGYRYTLRLFSSKDGAQLSEQKASVDGGPLDLAGGLEHGVCALLGAAPCTGTLLVRAGEGSDGVRLFVDGQDVGALPLARPLAIPVGRHVVRAGAEERRVRVSYHRDTRLRCERRGGAPALLDDTSDAAPARIGSPMVANATNPAPAAALSAAGAPGAGQAKVGKYLLVGGAVLLAAAAGLEWYARSQSAALDERYRSGALTEADKPSYSTVHTAGTTALVLGAAGLGTLGLGGLVLLLPASGPTPSGGAKAPVGAVVQGRF